jgi:flagellar biosynthesis anti-sigma factor FlgM
MRIDLNAIIPEAPDPGQSAKSSGQVASANSGAASPAGADTTKLSQDAGRVQDLAAQVNQFPEIRQDKVAALQQAIKDGSYSVTAAQSAEALISAIQIRSAA